MKARFWRGFWAGWAAHMLLFAVTDLGGRLAFGVQPFVACVPAAVFALVAEAAGWPLRETRLRTAWTALGRGAFVLAAVGAAMILGAAPLGIGRVVADGAYARVLLPMPYSMAAYFLCVFPFVNRPEPA